MKTYKIKIHQYLTLNNILETIEVEVTDPNEPLLKVCHQQSATNTFSHYYPYSESRMLNDRFPYIFRNGKYVWDVPIAEVTIKEFIDTFPDCLTEGIYIETMMPSAGGRDYLNPRIAWKALKLFVTTVCPHSSVPFGVVDLFLEVKDALNRHELQDQLSPPEFISFMYNNKGYKEMSEREIVELLGVEEYQAAVILRGIGYEKKADGSEKYELPDINRDKVQTLASKINDFDTQLAEKISSGSTEYIHYFD